MYTVEVKNDLGTWTHHTDWESYRDAVDQSDIARGRVLCETGLPDREAWEYGVSDQGFEGDYDDWTAQDDDERAEYEDGAQGIGTV